MITDPRKTEHFDEEDRAATAIDGMFAFLHKALDDPTLLDDHPEKGTIVFRTVDVDGHVFGLAAVRAANTDEWVARPFRYSLTAGAPMLQRPIEDGRSMLHDRAAIVESFRETGPTREAALDALERRPRAAVREAVRVDLD